MTRHTAKFALLLLLALASVVQAAITEKYVSSAGAGAHDGTSEANAYSWAEMITAINAGGAAGNRYNVKADATYSRTTMVDTISGDGTVTSPIIIRGYTTTIGDGFVGRTSSNGPLITTNMPVITYTTGRLSASGGDWIIYESLNLSCASSSPLLQISGFSDIVFCKLENTSTGSGGNAASSGSLFGCDILQSGASGGAAAISGAVNVSGCRIKSVSGNGITAGSSGQRAITENVIYQCGGNGVGKTATNAILYLHGNTITGCTGDGVNIVTGSTTHDIIVNCQITDNGGYGINGVSADNAIFAAHNRTRDNTAGATNLATDWLAATRYSAVTTDTGGAETDYVNAGSQDYRLIPGSPAKGAGHFQYRDIGALQRQETGSGISRSRAVNSSN